MQHSHLEKLNLSQPIKQLPGFYGAWNFTSAFTTAHNLSLSWARSIRSAPQNLNSLLFFFILFPYHRLVLPSGLLPSASPTKPCVHLCPPTVTCHTPSPLHSVLLLSRTDHEGHRPFSCYLPSLRSKFIHRRRNSKTLSLYISVNVRPKFNTHTWAQV
jgi:hypothetical protein